MGKKIQVNVLLDELRIYDDSGIALCLNGSKSTPEAIAKACELAETGSYMRDYVENKEGEVEELSFDLIKKT